MSDNISDPIEHDEHDDDVEDFDAFWSEHDKTRKHVRVKLFGQVVVLPASLPLQFELEAKKLARSKRDRDVRKLVAILFGAEAYESWAASGMDLDQFQLLLAWAPRRIAGQDVTLAQVADELAEREAKQDEKDDEQDADPS